jgi:hypothetical protein
MKFKILCVVFAVLSNGIQLEFDDYTKKKSSPRQIGSVLSKGEDFLAEEESRKPLSAEEKQEILAKMRGQAKKEVAKDPKEELMKISEDFQNTITPYEKTIDASEVKKKLENSKKILDFLKVESELEVFPSKFSFYQCIIKEPAFKPENNELSQINIKDLASLKELRVMFASLFNNIFKGLPKDFVKHILKQKTEHNPKEEFLRAVESAKSEFASYITKFSSITPPIEANIKKLECGMKDFTTFYSLLPRFYVAYVKGLELSDINSYFTTIGKAKDHWASTMNKALKEYYQLKSWTWLMNEMYRVLDKDPSRENLLDFYEYFNHQTVAITTSKVIWGKIFRSFKESEVKLTDWLKRLEKENKSVIEGFADHTDCYL